MQTLRVLEGAAPAACAFPLQTLPRNTKPHIVAASAFPSAWRKKDVWINPNTAAAVTKPLRHRPGHQQYLDHCVDMEQLLSSLCETADADQLRSVMSPYKNRQLSLRFMVSILSREPDWQRSLALLDWMMDEARYSPSIFAYNVVLRNVLRAGQWQLAAGLVDEMRATRCLTPDRFTYSTLISYFSKAGFFDSALSWLQQMEQDRISGDLVLYSNLIDLARKLQDYSKAISIFSRLKGAGITPDIVAYNSMINVYAKAGFFREARQLLDEMRLSGPSTTPDTVSYSTLLGALVEGRRFVEALSLFSEMTADPRCPLDLTTCNIMIDVYGQLDMVKEADRLFWGMRKMGIDPNVVSYNTMLRVYGEAELFGEAIHLFRLMQRKDVPQNVVTYNTMIKIYGKSLEHEKATNLVQEMQKNGVNPDTITYSTIISIWCKAGKLDRAAILFQKLRSSGVEIDHVLYQTMIVAYERAGLVGHAKRLLSELKRPDGTLPRTAAVTVLARAGRIEEATWVFRQAVDAGEMKDISVFTCMIELFSRNKKHGNVVEVFEKMRYAGYFPDSETIALVVNAYGKLQQFDKAEAVYSEMQQEGCVFTDRVHFQMLSVLGAQRNFKLMDSLFERLEEDPNISKKDLYLVAAGIYQRANRLDDAARITDRLSRTRA
ncbi:pentatricopeptide repeat-containing protein At5g39980, chloroplastic [Aristolochia californica]|uniref:pentatricopeptide repeat-containing protein At5g39980, chloroplastic n=1 Tax=Aristolochia californica TaxID=171875 RepID=UPI0035E0F249